MRISFTFAALIILSTQATAQQRQSTKHSILRARLDSIVRTALQTTPVVGMSVVVVMKDDTLLHQAYGHADLGLEAATTLTTTYRLVFPTAAIGIMQLVEQGRVALDDDAAQFFPELHWQGRRVTIRQLLDATSGLRDYHYLGDAQKLQRAIPQTTRELADLFMRYPYVHEPGAGSSWTISGFHIAGMLLERVIGKPYGDYLRDHIFRRAGLTRTFYCPEGEVTPGLATPYFYASGNRFVVAPYQSPSHYPFLLTVCTNASDAGSLMRALRDGRLLATGAYREMTTPVGAARETSRGVGVRIGEESGHRWIGGSGSLIGYNTTVYDFPDDSLTVVVLQNTIRPRGYTGSRVARELARAALELPPLPPMVIRPEEEMPRGIVLSAAARKRYHGVYDVEWAGGPSPLAFWKGSYRVFDDDAGRLMLHMPGVIPEPLIYVGEETFRIASDHEMRFTFTTVDGRLTLTLTQASNVLKGPRRPGS